MSKPNLIQMSSIVIDLIYQVDHVPTPGSEANVQKFNYSAGGGFNAMYAALRTGMEIKYGGMLGSGLFSDIAQAELTKCEISTFEQKSALADQGNSVVLIDKDGERTFISNEGIAGAIGPLTLKSNLFSEQDWILLSGYNLSYSKNHSDWEAWLNNLPAQTNFIFDPSPVIKAIPDELLEKVFSKTAWISTNIDEARLITGINSPALSAKALNSRQNSSAIGTIVRCGAHGCWVAMIGKEPIYIPAFTVNTIDTNGAGDTHLGSFIGAFCKYNDAIKAATYANAAAALSTTYRGPATAPDGSETLKFLADQNITL